MAEILVIRHGALGDVLQCFGPFAAIRAHHPHDRLTLLTGSAFAPLAAASRLFDRIIADDRPPVWHPTFLRTVLALRATRFARVYDLQRKDRSALLFRLLRAGRPQLEWSGTARGASHEYKMARDDRRHFRDKNAAQLAEMGIAPVPSPDLAFLAGDVTGFNLSRPYAVLVPGAAATRPKKRWPAAGYAALARALAGRGLAPILVGTAAEGETLRAVAAATPEARNLEGRTDMGQLASLLRGAALAVGNDTGPMHLAAIVGCPSLVLFSADSDPAMTRPIGAAVAILAEPDLAQLSAERVIVAAAGLLDGAPTTGVAVSP